MSFPNEGISGFLFAASRAAAEGDKRPGGADRTVDIQPPQSESILILSFDEIILLMIIVICLLLNHFMKSFDALMTLLAYFCRKAHSFFQRAQKSTSNSKTHFLGYFVSNMIIIRCDSIYRNMILDKF